MSPNLLRCRHYEVKWLNSHCCKCSSCGKHGHWFENEGLVMWVRAESEINSVPEQHSGLSGFLSPQTQSRLPSMAG